MGSGSGRLMPFLARCGRTDAICDQPRPPAVTTAYLFGGVSELLLLVDLSGAVLNWNASTTVERRRAQKTFALSY